MIHLLTPFIGRINLNYELSEQTQPVTSLTREQEQEQELSQTREQRSDLDFEISDNSLSLIFICIVIMGILIPCFDGSKQNLTSHHFYLPDTMF